MVLWEQGEQQSTVEILVKSMAPPAGQKADKTREIVALGPNFRIDYWSVAEVVQKLHEQTSPHSI